MTLDKHEHSRRWLTVIIAILAGVASVGGLTVPGLYRDAELFKCAWLANDAVTAILAPALLLVHVDTSGEVCARLLWLGILLYMFYNYAFYLFGAVFNWFFLIYVTLFTLSLYALLLALLITGSGGNIPKISKTSRRRWIAAFLLLVALPLATVEVGQYLRFILFGEEPQIPTLILALDLTLVIPNTILAAVMLLRNSP